MEESSRSRVEEKEEEMRSLRRKIDELEYEVLKQK